MSANMIWECRSFIFHKIEEQDCVLVSLIYFNKLNETLLGEAVINATSFKVIKEYKIVRTALYR